MLQAIAALKFAQSAKINVKNFCPHIRKSASTCFLHTNYAFGFLIDHSNRAVELCQQHKAAQLIYSASLALNATKGSTHFVPKNLLNKDSCQTNLVFLLPSIVLEGSGLDVIEKELVDAETEHGKI